VTAAEAKQNEEFLRNVDLWDSDAICCSIGTCQTKAVHLYDESDAEVRETIFRAFGKVSRSQFEALCAKGYKGRKHLVTEVMYTEH
jgi:hypothetical protein